MRVVGDWRCVGALAVGLTASLVAGCLDDAPPYIVDVGASHRFLADDDPRFAAPDFDDSSWRTVTLPATWRVRTPRAEVFGWHRLYFEVREPVPAGGLALEVGAIAWADEVFLNGQRIGTTGWLHRVPRLGPRPRLYEVPAGSLQAGTNVLAIRVRGIPFGVSGLFASRIGIGKQLDLERAGASALSRTQLVEGILMGFLGLGWFLVAFFPKRGRPGRATLFLLASITLAFVMLCLLSVTFRRAGLIPEVGGNVVLGVGSLAGAFYWGFVATVARGMLPRFIKALIVAEMVVSMLLFSWPNAIGVLIIAAMIVGTGALAAMCWLLIGAARARTPGVIFIAIGCVVAALTVLAMLVLPDPFLVALPLIYYGLASAIAFAVLALTRHVHAMNQQVQRATEYSLEAHRRERSRLARDLHDGLGQMLALLKMQMQRMGRKHEGEPVQRVFDESADQVATTLDELRRIARDLRPAPMQDRGFGEAVREYAASIMQRTDLIVEVEGDYADPLSEEVGDELYRISQECLTNCLKHSGARRVVVTLAEVGDRYKLRVVDDGRGLSAQIPPGLGLATIRERSELLGGECSITTASGGGTQVEVSVPR